MLLERRLKRMVSAVILCGGKATRLRPVTQNIPKAMVKVNGRPIIDRQLEWLASHGITDVVLACGYKSKVLKAHLGEKVKYSVESKPLGTGGALKKALELVTDKDCVVINGDNISNVDLKLLMKNRKRANPLLTLVQFRCPYGVYRKGTFTEKPILDDWISAGIYYFSPKALDKLIAFDRISSIEKEYFACVPIDVYRHRGKWITIDSKKDLDDAEELLK